MADRRTPALWSPKRPEPASCGRRGGAARSSGPARRPRGETGCCFFMRTHVWVRVGARQRQCTWLRDRASQPASASGSTTMPGRSEEHTSELQSLMRISYAVFCLKKKTSKITQHEIETNPTYDEECNKEPQLQ